MAATAPPLPPRDLRALPLPDAVRRSRQQASMILLVVFVVIGVSFVLSFNRSAGGFMPEAPTYILFAVLVAAIIYVAFRYTRADTRRCLACGRAIPLDAGLCPYCGQRLS